MGLIKIMRLGGRMPGGKHAALEVGIQPAPGVGTHAATGTDEPAPSAAVRHDDVVDEMAPWAPCQPEENLPRPARPGPAAVGTATAPLAAGTAAIAAATAVVNP